MNINDQLNIGVAPSPLTPTRYTRGLKTSQPQLGTEDWSLDYYNDARSLANYNNANGWDGNMPETYSNFKLRLSPLAAVIGSYPGICTGICQQCKHQCKSVQGLKWNQGGKECFRSCEASLKAQKKGLPTPTGLPSQQPAPTQSGQQAGAQAQPQGTGMSTGAKVGLIVGGVAVLGVAAYLIFRKK